MSGRRLMPQLDVMTSFGQRDFKNVRRGKCVNAQAFSFPYALRVIFQFLIILVLNVYASNKISGGNKKNYIMGNSGDMTEKHYKAAFID